MSLRQQVRLLLARRRQTSKQRQTNLLVRPAVELGIQPRFQQSGIQVLRSIGPVAYPERLATTPVG